MRFARVPSSDEKRHAQFIARRAELIVELFLQDLDPLFATRPTEDFGFDYLIGFTNSQNGLNLIAVEVKSTERPIEGHFSIQKRLYERWSHSNIPVLLLVVDVKQNQLFYALPTPHGPNGSSQKNTIAVNLTEIDEKTKKELRDRLVS